MDGFEKPPLTAASTVQLVAPLWTRLSKLRCELDFLGSDSRRREIFLRRRPQVLRQGRDLRAVPSGQRGQLPRHPEQVERDLAQMREIGLNVVRIYHVPPRWFLDRLRGRRHARPDHAAVGKARRVSAANACARRDRRDGAARRSPRTAGIRRSSAISSATKSPARWCAGSACRRVTEFVEKLIRIGRETDPRPLFLRELSAHGIFCSRKTSISPASTFTCTTSATSSVTCCACKICREERPLILGEFGMDTIRHTEDEQAEMLGWHIESVVRCGLAGTIFFAWTDEWFTGEQEITDWAFGIVTRTREPKKAFHVLRENSARTTRLCRIGVAGRSRSSRSSSVPTTARKTLAECLESLGKIDYPNYEVILVDDGSTDNTREIAARFPNVRYVHQTNHGLSHARNHGAAVGQRRDFRLHRLRLHGRSRLALLFGRHAAERRLRRGGGAECFAAGAELGPGLRRGGAGRARATFCSPTPWPSTFRVVTWPFTAGRLRTSAASTPSITRPATTWIFAGASSRPAASSPSAPPRSSGIIAVSPCAPFANSRKGYGEAESMLRFKHLVFFGPTGTAKWRGQIYGTPRFSWFINRPIIYHGVFGEGFFQSIYPTPQSEVAAYLSSIEWFALTVFLFGLGIFLPAAAHRALSDVRRNALRGALLHGARAHRAASSTRSRRGCWSCSWLSSSRSCAGWSRYFTWLHFKRTPRSRH